MIPYVISKTHSSRQNSSNNSSLFFFDKNVGLTFWEAFFYSVSSNSHLSVQQYFTTTAVYFVCDREESSKNDAQALPGL